MTVVDLRLGKVDAVLLHPDSVQPCVEYILVSGHIISGGDPVDIVEEAAEASESVQAIVNNHDALFSGAVKLDGTSFEYSPDGSVHPELVDDVLLIP